MPLFSFEGHAPTVHASAWIAPTATVVGDVTIEAGASIWYGVVLRADFGPIVVRAGANVQDGSVVHGGPVTTEIGEGTTIAHLVSFHGSRTGREALVGNGAVVQDGCTIGDRALVAAGAVVPPNTVVDAETLFRGTAGAPAGPLSAGARRWVETNPEGYRALARRHANGIEPV